MGAENMNCLDTNCFIKVVFLGLINTVKNGDHFEKCVKKK
jgi:hypothetical protein